jgi:hypothetical protein
LATNSTFCLVSATAYRGLNATDREIRDELMERQASRSVLLVRPASFRFNPETAASNAFASEAGDEIADAVLREFDAAVRRLEDAGVEVLVLEDTPEPPKPDAIFPNNWVSFHADGTMVLYPMESPSRQREREPERLTELLAGRGFEVRRTIDLSHHERHGRFLEGTGSLVLDRPERRAFANLSPRTDPHVIADFDDRLDYTTFLFDARDRSGRPIYHTNVLLSLGTRFAALCTEAVAEEYRAILIDEIEASGRSVIAVDFEQLRNFACNVIELEGRKGPVIAISAAALGCLQPDQLKKLESFGELLDVPISTIERVGGGSIRCMIADIHLPRG